MNPVPLFLIIVTLPLLLGGCGEKNESTTETKSVEEKVMEVKDEVKPEEPVAETKPELEGVNQDELEEREGIICLKGSAYTGKSYDLYPNGQKWIENNFKDGKRDGLQTHWRENGTKMYEANYKDGKKDGLLVQWHENGQKMSERNLKDDKEDGLDIRWYKNGQKRWEQNWKNGKQEGLWVTWHENGQKKGEVTYKDGKIVEGSLKYWNSKGEPVDSWEEAVVE
ncbi:MAG: toxin-antitoxin system YwqK family antitoxin [Verrucomicrobiales bacterium]